MNDSKTILGAVEAGGTKFVCSVGLNDGTVLEEVRFPTESPAESLPQMIDFFKKAELKFGKISAFGLGAFGPVVVNPRLPNYGVILATPKKGWQGANLLELFYHEFPNVPVELNTDVNAAALGEGVEGAAVGLNSYVYITVGTGIGGGVIVDGKPLAGVLHPEIGHLAVNPIDDIEGVCSFHKNCVEGLASGPAIEARWGRPAYELPADHEAWALEARYLADLARTLTAVLSPQRIIFGGGVMEQPQLLPLIREEFQKLNNGYWDVEEDFIQTAALGNQAGVKGCFELARQAMRV